ncbi:MAG: glycerate kinase [Deltaproteobacteria bacterium]|jgi:glycerate kinase|nr:glycerate kinase [Deltaproteobacteria bacterium]
MKIVIAPDSFKGSLSALEAAKAIKKGLLRVWPEAAYVLFPIADGGEGTVETLVDLTDGKIITGPAKDPLGREVTASYGFLSDGTTAVLEMASACGLTRLKKEELNPAVTSTRGLGEQLREALARGAKKLIVGLGGSATNDGGSGMLAALGVKFLDKNGGLLPPGGLALADLDKIETSPEAEKLSKIPIVIASDVQNPLLGPDGASAVFGPQKGADPDLVEKLDLALSRYAQVAKKLTGREVAQTPGAGAAGGLGAAFLLFTEAKFCPGVEVVLNEGSFDQKAADASLIVTGEGRSDGQTVWGKAPVGVAERGQKLGVPTVCLSASLGQGYQKMYEKNISAIMAMTPGPLSLEEAMANAAPLLEDAAERLARLLATKPLGR